MSAPVTADTITDEQILEVLEDAQYREWKRLAFDCYIALHGVTIRPATRRRSAIRKKAGPGYLEARARVAAAFSNIRKPADECSTCGAVHDDVDCFGEAVRP